MVALVVAFATLLGTTITAAFAYAASRQTKAINRAVNNVPADTPPLTSRIATLEGQMATMIEGQAEKARVLNDILEAVTKPEQR
jgi:hypothetical protein